MLGRRGWRQGIGRTYVIEVSMISVQDRRRREMPEGREKKGSREQSRDSLVRIPNDLRACSWNTSGRTHGVSEGIGRAPRLESEHGRGHAVRVRRRGQLSFFCALRAEEAEMETRPTRVKCSSTRK